MDTFCPCLSLFLPLVQQQLDFFLAMILKIKQIKLRAITLQRSKSDIFNIAITSSEKNIQFHSTRNYLVFWVHQYYFFLMLFCSILQLAKILLLSSKCEIIFVTLQKWQFFPILRLPIQLSLFQLCDSKSCCS